MKINILEPRKDNSADTIHIDNFDCWSLDFTLARIIHPALIRLKETKHGYPELWEDGMVTHHNWDRQLHFDFIDEDIESTYLINKWNGILDKMIYSFGKIMEDAYFDNEEWERIQEGLDLFSKHYTSLWD
tara:strand:- start:1452 stop:1841 length:390 start_codon:yes stop_codon:yes gene_type:complete